MLTTVIGSLPEKGEGKAVCWVWSLPSLLNAMKEAVEGCAEVSEGAADTGEA